MAPSSSSLLATGRAIFLSGLAEFLGRAQNSRPLLTALTSLSARGDGQTGEGGLDTCTGWKGVRGEG